LDTSEVSREVVLSWYLSGFSEIVRDQLAFDAGLYTPSLDYYIAG